MYFPASKENSKLHSNLYTTDICSKGSYEDSSQMTYHSTLSEKSIPYHYNGLSLKDSQEDTMSQIRNSMKPTQQEEDIENFQSHQDQENEKKGWDSFATRLWGRLPKGAKVGSTTLAYGITNLLGIDTVEETEERLIHDNMDSMPLFQPKTVKVSENELISNSLLNFNEKQLSIKDDNISCHSVKSLDDMETEEVTELRQMLKVNQKAFSKAIKDQTTLIYKLQKEQENLLETLRITNKEREEQENLLSKLNISLNQTSQQVEILKSKLLHYKHVFRRCDFPSIPSQSQLFIPDIAPFEVEQILGETRVDAQIQLAITIGGDLYLVIDRNEKKHFINTSHIIEMNLNLENGPSEFFLVTVSKGSFLFIIHTDDALKECIKLFQCNFYLKTLIKKKLRASETFDKRGFLISQLEDFFGLPTYYSNKNNKSLIQITKQKPLTKRFISNISPLSNDICKPLQNHYKETQKNKFLNASKSFQFPFNANVLTTQNFSMLKNSSYNHNIHEDSSPKKMHSKNKRIVNKNIQNIAPFSNLPTEENQLNEIGQLVSSHESLLDPKVDMNKFSSNRLEQDQNQCRILSPSHFNEKPFYDSNHNGTVKAICNPHNDLDFTLRVAKSGLKPNSISPILKNKWKKKIPLEILEEELSHRVTFQSSKSCDSLTDSTGRTYNYAAFLLTESEKC